MAAIIPASVSRFDRLDDFEGWDCGKITTCGEHQFCGGYGVKGEGSDITKTFRLPPGTYSVELDFIKIDSWFVSRSLMLGFWHAALCDAWFDWRSGRMPDLLLMLVNTSAK